MESRKKQHFELANKITIGKDYLEGQDIKLQKRISYILERY